MKLTIVFAACVAAVAVAAPSEPTESDTTAPSTAEQIISEPSTAEQIASAPSTAEQIASASPTAEETTTAPATIDLDNLATIVALRELIGYDDPYPFWYRNPYRAYPYPYPTRAYPYRYPTRVYRYRYRYPSESFYRGGGDYDFSPYYYDF